MPKPYKNRYKIGFEDLRKVQVMEQEIAILSASCYLATKFEAFNNRGKDYRTSHDMEDIIYVLDNRLHIVEEIRSCDDRIRAFLKEQLDIMHQQGILSEVLMAHIHPLMLEERLPLVEEKIHHILSF